VEQNAAVSACRPWDDLNRDFHEHMGGLRLPGEKPGFFGVFTMFCPELVLVKRSFDVFQKPGKEA
jgi:hypothetical protein